MGQQWYKADAFSAGVNSQQASRVILKKAWGLVISPKFRKDNKIIKNSLAFSGYRLYSASKFKAGVYSNGPNLSMNGDHLTSGKTDDPYNILSWIDFLNKKIRNSDGEG